MRPLHLAVEAFGPFADRQEVDFTALADEGLFLIWGPTGAGKSFLLDALCFALYGRTAGDRPVPRLHSDHARGATPRVELRFRMGGEEWCVRREAPRWRTRRDGRAAQTATKAVLERIVPGGVDVVAHKVTDVDRILTDRLGLTVEEFRRVVLLPQGRFEQVLRASSADREALLASIFGTHRFDEVARVLDEQARASARAIDEVAQAQQVRRRTVADACARLTVDLGPELAAIAEVVAPEVRAAVAPSQGDPDALDAIDDALASAVAQVDAAVAAAVTRRDETREVARRTADAVARWDRRADLQHAGRALADAAPEVEARRTELAAAERAAQVAPALALAQRAHREVRAATSRHGLAAEAVAAAWSSSPLALGGALRTPVWAPDELAAADATWVARARRAVARRSAEVDTAAEAAQLAHDARAALAEARQARQAAATAVARWGAEAERAELDRAEATRQLVGAEALASGLDAASEEVARLEGWAVAARRLPTLDAEVRTAEGAALGAARAEVDAQRRLGEVQQRRLDGMAAELAGLLVDGEACPVCGADAHPAPARPAPDAASADDVATAEQALTIAREGRIGADAQVDAARARRAEVVAAAGEAAADLAQVETRLEAALGARAEARAARADLARRRSAVTDAEGVVAECRRRVEEATAAEVAAVEATATLEARVADAAEAADRVLGRGAGRVEADRAAAALGALHDALADLDRTRTEVASAAAAGVAAATELGRALEAAGFDDATAAAEAARDPAERRRLGRIITEWERETARVQAALDAPDLADLPDDRPDAEPSAAEAATAEAAHQGLVEARARLQATAGVVHDTVAAHREDAAHLAVAAAEHEVRHRLAEVCCGRTADRVSLQRWVLAAHLETICARANDRLGVMSAGRYALQVHTESSRGARAGLDLRVLDTHSGEEREVTTLSGGETFQASLALALGVADVVTERSGGIELDVLFVDEGFGTLDPDALHLALDELDRLRAGGRMVGVISHVTGLRERIGAGIEVRRTRSGSEVHVGAAPVA